MFNPWKPWYVYRPQQLLRRAATLFEQPASGYTAMSAAWGMTLLASPTEHIGLCLRTTGIYDIAVSEVLFRLIRRGDLFVDAGANLGYMTLLGGVACGAAGQVIAFEPNPDLFALLSRNVESARRASAMAPLELRETALGPSVARATLVLPDPSAHNTGLAYIPRNGEDASGRRSVNVPVETLDDVVGERTVGVLKVDVEGYEYPLLQGAARALSQHRIRHVVFEDHEGVQSAAATLLRSAGYTLFAIGWSMTGPVLDDTSGGRLAAAYYEAPSYLATIAPAEAIAACVPRGWRALRNQTRAREAA